MKKGMSAFVNTVVGAVVRIFMKSIPQGTATQMYLTTAPSVKGGEFYSDVNIQPSHPHSHNAEMGQRLWAVSEKFVAPFV